MKVIVSLEIEGEGDLYKLIPAWIANNLNQNLEVFDPEMEEEKVGEITIISCDKIEVIE